MKKTHWIIAGAVFLAAVLAVAAFLYLKKGGDNPAQPQGHVHGIPQATAQPPVPMEEETPTIEITDDQQRLIGVKTVPAETATMVKTIRAAGRIEYDEQQLFTMNAKVEGWIERLHADTTGLFLKKGDPLLEIYSPELLAAQQELISLSAWKRSGGTSPVDTMLDADAERLKDAARHRLRLWDISEAQIDRIVRTGKAERTLTIASPVSGYVVKRYATRGMRVMAGEPLLDMAGLSRVWVVTEVNEGDAGIISQGMPVRISVSGLEGRSFSAKIDFIYPVLDGQTRTLRVRCTLENPDLVLRPQMFASVELWADLGTRLAIPEDAVMNTGERQLVYVDRGEGMFEPRRVSTGISAGGRREILSGLKAGEKVAASALFLIDSEAQLKGVAPAAP
ncbi:MAG: efflux RND transporter periplasmic adaptor subunit [Desulfobacterota bacterium]|jgi:Cu(I)/Ag(I) efflux system membrane fusion protein|nr:efflux RND transporter periplasmic adaptor subunit [Thermodesulfobacteriota bacterium]